MTFNEFLQTYRTEWDLLFSNFTNLKKWLEKKFLNFIMLYEPTTFLNLVEADIYNNIVALRFAESAINEWYSNTFTTDKYGNVGRTNSSGAGHNNNKGSITYTGLNANGEYQGNQNEGSQTTVAEATTNNLNYMEFFQTMNNFKYLETFKEFEKRFKFLFQLYYN